MTLNFTPIDQIPVILSGLKKEFINETQYQEALWKDLHKDPKSVFFYEESILKNEIVHCLEKLDEWTDPQNVEKNPILNIADTCQIRNQPLGTVLIVAPWNFPLQLAIAPLAAAISAGNTVLLKPSEISPNVAKVMTDQFNFLNFPEIKVVNGGVPEMTAILEQRFDMIFYTGNTTVGKIVMKAASKFLTPVVLELGGKSPMIIDSDSDLKTVARRIMWAKCVNSGQICVAPDYVLCKQEIVAEFVSACKIAVNEFFGPDPSKSEFYGRIVSLNHHKRIMKLVNDQAAVKGSLIVFGGQGDEKDLYIPPTVITGVGKDSNTNPIMSQEVFGPILPIVTVESIDEAISYVNSREKPLSLSVFSRNQSVCDKVINSTFSGGALSNDLIMNMGVYSLPFGGVGESGMGYYHGKDGFDAFSHRKSVHLRPHGMEFMNEIRYYPLTDIKISILNRIFFKSISEPLPKWIKVSLKTLFNGSLYALFFVLGWYFSKK